MRGKEHNLESEGGKEEEEVVVDVSLTSFGSYVSYVCFHDLLLRGAVVRGAGSALGRGGSVCCVLGRGGSMC